MYPQTYLEEQIGKSDWAHTSTTIPVWPTSLLCKQFYTTTPNSDFPFRAADPHQELISAADIAVALAQ
jgi:hypothetical protein